MKIPMVEKRNFMETYKIDSDGVLDWNTEIISRLLVSRNQFLIKILMVIVKIGL